MITRSEHCAKAPGETDDLVSRRIPAGVWDLTLILGAATYVLLALFDAVDSPIVGLIIVVAVGRRLVQHRLARR